MMMIMEISQIPFSEACERNKEPIREILLKYLRRGHLLEMGFGTAQHAFYFANQFPNIKWFASDVAENQHTFIQRQNQTKELPPNLWGPLELRARVDKTLSEQLSPQLSQINYSSKFDYFFTANTLHIMSLEEVEIFCQQVHEILSTGALLFFYGPFKFRGEFTSVSNANFDQNLRSRGVGSCIKDFEWIRDILKNHKIEFSERNDLPANNQLLVFRSS